MVSPTQSSPENGKELIGTRVSGGWRNPSPTAKAYVQAGLGLETIASLKRRGVNIQDADETLIIASLMKRGYSFERARYYGEHHTPVASIKSFDKVERMLASVCHRKVYNELQLLYASPYATTGRCYIISFGEVSQWLGPNTALVGGKVLVEFRTSASSNIIRNLLVQGQGAYTYTSVTGALTTVPRVRMMDQLSDTMTY